jgi:hypothetical protein
MSLKQFPSNIHRGTEVGTERLYNLLAFGGPRLSKLSADPSSAALRPRILKDVTKLTISTRIAGSLVYLLYTEPQLHHKFQNVSSIFHVLRVFPRHT